jgi:hypothetical protein
MGYYIHYHDSQFTIPADKMDAALLALKAASAQASFRWTDDSSIQEATTLLDAMDECGWPIEVTEIGVMDITFARKKIGDEHRVFAAIAPFVDAGCFIEVTGDYTDHWRYIFDGTTMKEVYPTVTW